MPKKALLPLAAVAVVLSGCATLPTGAPATALSRTYSDSRSSIWQRILLASASRSMFVRQADPVNGLIVVDREFAPSPQSKLSEDMISNWAWCGSGGVFALAVNQRIEINYMVRAERDGRTTVTLNSRFRELRADDPRKPPQWVECNSTGVLERDIIQSLYYGPSA
jgi:hypothetical protein